MINNRFSNYSTINTSNNNTTPHKTIKGIHDNPVVFVDNIIRDGITIYLLHIFLSCGFNILTTVSKINDSLSVFQQ